ncbi:divalent-cation tolerance protein CutA [bacterium]|nr:divalent-cation tolerance protein CutA [bacterium]
MESDYYVVLVTLASISEAKSIATHLVNNRLAACVNILPKAVSIYWWEGAIEECREYLMLVKTRRDKLTLLEEEIHKLHSYEVPEIVALPIVEGSSEYLRWIDSSLNGN